MLTHLENGWQVDQVNSLQSRVLQLLITLNPSRATFIVVVSIVVSGNLFARFPTVKCIPTIYIYRFISKWMIKRIQNGFLPSYIIFIYRTDHLLCIVFSSIGWNTLISTERDGKFFKKVYKFTVYRFETIISQKFGHQQKVTCIEKVLYQNMPKMCCVSFLVTSNNIHTFNHFGCPR